MAILAEGLTCHRKQAETHLKNASVESYHNIFRPGEDRDIGTVSKGGFAGIPLRILWQGREFTASLFRPLLLIPPRAMSPCAWSRTWDKGHRSLSHLL